MACAAASGVSRFTLMFGKSKLGLRLSKLPVGLRELTASLRELRVGLVEREPETGGGSISNRTSSL